jgi:PAS domain S-box-containing protein
MNKSGQVQLTNPADEMMWINGQEFGMEQCSAFKGWWGELMKRVQEEQWAVQRALVKGEITRHELREVVCFNGKRKIIAHSAVPILNRQQEVAGAIAVNEDITERKQAEEQIRAQARLLDLAHDAIVVRDLEGHVQFWNQSAERLWGWTAQEANGRKITELVYPETEPFEAAMKLLLEKGEWSGELQPVNKSGQEVIVNSRWTLLGEDQGQRKSVLVIETDITEQKKMETQFLRAQRMESMGILAGGVAHDLNNALAPIQMAHHMLREKVLDAESRQLLDTIVSCARRAADMVKQILTFSRGVEGKRMHIQLPHLINELNKLALNTFPKTIQIDTNVPKDIWTVVGNRTQLYQVLLNLSINARDAMPHGGKLTISAENAELDEQYAAMNPEAKPGLYIILTVADTGMGMTEEVKSHLFEPFFTTKKLGEGTGLGLFTALRIVRSHGGFMRVNSKPRQGSTFKVYLPAETAAAAETVRANHVRLPRGHGELALVVDDEASVRIICQQTLEVYGYRALTASHGAEAVGLYAQWPGDIAVVVIDMLMPIMDGPSTIHALRRLNPQVKIIAISGVSSEEYSNHAALAGVKGALAKPFTTAEFLQALDKVLHGQKADAVVAGDKNARQ